MEPASRLNRILLFLVGYLTIFSVQIVGRLSWAEILMLATAPFVFAFQKASLKEARLLLLLLVAYLASAVATDRIQHTLFEDYSRGWAKLCMMGLAFVWIVKMTNFRPQNLIWFFLGWACCTLTNSASNPFEPTEYKFYTGPGITLLLACIAALWPQRLSEKTCGACMIALSMVHFAMNARSCAGMTMMTGFLILLLYTNLAKRILAYRLEAIFLLTVLVAGLSWTVVTVYQYGAAEGFLGQEAQSKYQMQSSVEGNVFLAARGEYISSFAAIADSPLIGHGSWAKDEKYIGLYLESQGMDINSENAKGLMDLALIPTHSHFFGAWVETGVFGAVFWGYVIYLVGVVLYRAIALPLEGYRPLLIYLSLLLLWDIMFSPFGLERRVNNAAMLVLLFSVITYDKVLQQFRAGSMPNQVRHYLRSRAST